MVLDSCQDVTVRGNTIGKGFRPAIYVELSRDVHIADNISEEPSTVVVNEARTTGLSTERNTGLTLDTNSKPYFSRLKYVNDLR